MEGCSSNAYIRKDVRMAVIYPYLPEKEALRRLYKALRYIGAGEKLRRQQVAGLIPAAKARQDIAEYMAAARETVRGIVEIPRFSTPAKAGLILERALYEGPEEDIQEVTFEAERYF